MGEVVFIGIIPIWQHSNIPFFLLILLLILVIWFSVSADNQNSEGQPVQYVPAEVPKLPVLVKLNVMDHGVKIPFKVAILDDEGNLIEVTNKSEIMLENGMRYELVVFNESYWVAHVDLPLYLDFDCNCTALKNGSVYLYKIVPVEMEPIIPPAVRYFKDEMCVFNPNDRVIEATMTRIYIDGHNETRTFRIYDSMCFDFHNGIVNITVELPDYKLLNKMKFYRYLG